MQRFIWLVIFIACASHPSFSQIPTSSGEYYNRATARYDRGDVNGAIADFSKSIELYPYEPEVYLKLAQIYSKLGQKKKSDENLRKAIDINRNRLQRGTRNLSPEYEALTIAIMENPKDGLPFLKRAYIRLVNGDIDAAIADCDLAISTSSHVAEAYYFRGNAHAEKADMGKAIADYSKAIEINPNHEGAYNNRGNAKQASGDHQGAIPDFDRAIALKPNDAGAYYNRGISQYETNELDKAIADFSKTIEIDAKFAAAYGYRGLALLVQGNEKEAQKDFDQGLRLRESLRPSLEEKIKEATQRRAKKKRT
jgi:tetratricopeptide (TPR) repeat protein